MTKAAAAKVDAVVARQNTTIETLAEAVENVCMATVASMGKQPSNMAKTFAADARTQLRTALRAFVAPHLRLIEGGGHQHHDPDISEEDRIVCGACNRDRICSDANCPNWHEAIRAHINPPDDVA